MSKSQDDEFSSLCGVESVRGAIDGVSVYVPQDFYEFGGRCVGKIENGQALARVRRSGRDGQVFTHPTNLESRWVAAQNQGILLSRFFRVRDIED